VTGNTYRVSGNKRVGTATYWRIGVPRDIAESIDGIELTCELTEAGLIYRPSSVHRGARPSWARPLTTPDGSCAACNGERYVLDHTDVFGRHNYLRCPACGHASEGAE
jgi:hypothetical protein